MRIIKYHLSHTKAVLKVVKGILVIRVTHSTQKGEKTALIEFKGLDHTQTVKHVVNELNELRLTEKPVIKRGQFELLQISRRKRSSSFRREFRFEQSIDFTNGGCEWTSVLAARVALDLLKTRQQLGLRPL